MTYAVLQNDAYPKLYGGAAKFWAYKGREVILHGPYETGKTFATLTKLHALLCKYPKSQALMVRQTYKSIVSSACVTFDTKVLVYPPGDARQPIDKYGGEKPDFYLYPNGSRLWVGGLDNPGKFLSAEFDFIYINQAEETALESYETLTGRASGRAGNAPYTQVMADCNPGPPRHWILQRALAGSLELIQQTHRYNPTLYNQETGELTERGKLSMATLQAMTGLRYQRGYLGLWVMAEGAVFENFSMEADGNVTVDAEYNPNLPIMWGVDDGYARGDGVGHANYHPRVIGLAQQTPQGGMNFFHTYIQVGELGETSIANVLKLCPEGSTTPYPPPEVVYIDSSAVELKQRIWNMGFQTVSSTHPVHEGIKNVRRLVCDGNGVRLLKIHPRCTEMINEFQSYRYDPDSKVSNVGEPKPLKVDDHSIDMARYLCWHLHYE